MIQMGIIPGLVHYQIPTVILRLKIFWMEGSYTIKLSALGFKEKTIENIIISASNLKIELGEVIMFESSYQLEFG